MPNSWSHVHSSSKPLVTGTLEVRWPLPVGLRHRKHKRVPSPTFPFDWDMPKPRRQRPWTRCLGQSRTRRLPPFLGFIKRVLDEVEDSSERLEGLGWQARNNGVSEPTLVLFAEGNQMGFRRVPAPDPLAGCFDHLGDCKWGEPNLPPVLWGEEVAVCEHEFDSEGLVCREVLTTTGRLKDDSRCSTVRFHSSRAVREFGERSIELGEAVLISLLIVIEKADSEWLVGPDRLKTRLESVSTPLHIIAARNDPVRLAAGENSLLHASWRIAASNFPSTRSTGDVVVWSMSRTVSVARRAASSFSATCSYWRCCSSWSSMSPISTFRRFVWVPALAAASGWTQMAQVPSVSWSTRYTHTLRSLRPKNAGECEVTRTCASLE